MVKFYRVMYHFWRAIGAVAFKTFHTTQALAHDAYVRGGRHGRRVAPRKPLTALWKMWQSVKAKF